MKCCDVLEVTVAMAAPAKVSDELQSFYFEDRPALSNEEFDNLKEELLWQGSKVAVLR